MGVVVCKTVGIYPARLGQIFESSFLYLTRFLLSYQLLYNNAYAIHHRDSMKFEHVLYNVTYIVSVLGIVFTAFAVSIRNNTPRYRAFSFFAVSVGLWVGFQYAAQLAHSNHTLALYLLRAATVSSGLLAYFFAVFATHYFDKKMKPKPLIYLAIAPLILLPLGFTKLSIAAAEINQSGIAVKEAGIAYLLSLAMIAIYTTVSIAVIVIKTRKSDPYEKKRVNLLLLAIAQVAIFNILGVILLSKSTISQLIVPISALIMVGLVAYAIIRHKLFDIRSFVFRAMVYIFSVAFIAALYTILVYGVSGLLIDISNITYVQRFLFAVLALLIAFTYAPIVRFFNKVTVRTFFRDAYETQVVLDKVSNVIVGSVDPHKVQKGALTALSEAMRPSYMVFLFVRGGKLVQGDQVGQAWHPRNTELLDSALSKVSKKAVLYDELEERQRALREVLGSEDISVVSPLLTKDELIGYLLLGPKKSGNLYTSQDVGLLNIATNELAVALQNAQRFEEIQAFNLTLQEKVTEATRELKVTNKKLVALDEAKDEFISMASHQLRTPLTSIKGYLSMMVEGDLGKVTPAQEKALKEAFGSSQRMVFLIADFLNVSRIKTGKFMIEPKEVFLPEIVREEITQLREMADSRDLKLVYEQPEDFPKVMLDDNKIRQVMMNMVDNAIYYTPSGGEITIQLYPNGKEIIFKVVDTGIGVPKEEQHKLFAKFYRAGNARKARPDGTGLGLFMAQKIVAEQGGSIIFESTEGKGSTFGFRFPLDKVRA